MITLNGVEIKPTIFPDNTSQIWKLPYSWDGPDPLFPSQANIAWNFDNEAEFMHLDQLVDLLRKNLVECLHLFLPYLPYARQDKTVDNHKTFALSTFSKLLNSLEFDSITIYDAHSDVATALIKNSVTEFPEEALSKALSAINFKSTNDLICFPDFGAEKRYAELFHYNKTITLSKTRNQQTGQLSIEKIPTSLKNKTVLIVDDLCDGGGTFILAANELYKAGAKEVYLYTTHGLYSKGVQVLKDAGIKRIFNLKGEI